MLSEIMVQHERIEALCRQHHVRRLAVFGSSLRGDFDPDRSDIDLVVEFEQLPPAKYADNYFSLLGALKSLFGRNVDLVSLRSIRNPYFLEEIKATQENLYAA
jgi:uncharacterized protein